MHGELLYYQESKWNVKEKDEIDPTNEIKQQQLQQVKGGSVGKSDQQCRPPMIRSMIHSMRPTQHPTPRATVPTIILGLIIHFLAIKLPEFQGLVNKYDFENAYSMHYYSHLMQNGALFCTITTDDIYPTQHPTTHPTYPTPNPTSKSFENIFDFGENNVLLNVFEFDFNLNFEQSRMFCYFVLFSFFLFFLIIFFYDSFAVFMFWLSNSLAVLT